MLRRWVTVQPNGSMCSRILPQQCCELAANPFRCEIHFWRLKKRTTWHASILEDKEREAVLENHVLHLVSRVFSLLLQWSQASEGRNRIAATPMRLGILSSLAGGLPSEWVDGSTATGPLIDSLRGSGLWNVSSTLPPQQAWGILQGSGEWVE